MTGIAAASFFSNACRFGGCGLHFPTLAELIEHIEDNHIDTDPRVLEKQELQQPTYVALSYINRKHMQNRTSEKVGIFLSNDCSLQHSLDKEEVRFQIPSSTSGWRFQL